MMYLSLLNAGPLPTVRTRRCGNIELEPTLFSFSILPRYFLEVTSTSLQSNLSAAAFWADWPFVVQLLPLSCYLWITWSATLFIGGQIIFWRHVIISGCWNFKESHVATTSPPFLFFRDSYVKSILFYRLSCAIHVEQLSLAYALSTCVNPS